MISLLTNGWICYSKRTTIRRFVLPMNLDIQSLEKQIDLHITNVKTNLTLDNITDKNINLKLTDKNINIKKSNTLNIGVNKCSQDS